MVKLFKLLILLLLIAILVGWQQYQQFLTTPITLSEQPTIYTLQPGSNLQTVSRDLVEKGISSLPATYLHLYGRITGKAKRIKAGQYTLKAGTTLPELLDQFIDGKVVQYPFTIIEGMTSAELISMLAAEPKLEKTIQDTSLNTIMSSIGKPERHGEGEFAPETYYFTSGTSDIAILKRAHNLLLTILETAWKNRARDLPYKTPYEALIMASIIEKETGIAEERPEIAGVFVRRLNKGMRLQTDPTVIYGLGDKFDGNLRRKDLITDTPYNTYTRFGLPPTPIALASKEAIIAALNPKEGTSLYFVATGHEGRHYFSDTLAEHNRAVRKYQLKK